jgi:hypothetical protein
MAPPKTDRDEEKDDQPAGPYDPPYAVGHEDPREHIARLHHTLTDLRTAPGFAPASAHQAMVKESIALAGVHAHVASINREAAVAVFLAAYDKAADRVSAPSSGISPQKTASER